MMNNTNPDLESNLEKITKLLAKAESTTNPHEAEAFTAKAMDLMNKWMIDDAMLAAHGGSGKPDTVIKFVVDITGTYHAGHKELVCALGRGFGFKNVLLGGTHQSWNKTGVHERVCWIGFESDIEKAKLLYGSLLIQMAAALKDFTANQPGFKGYTGMDKFKTRRSFMFGFAAEIKSRLIEARRSTRADAEVSTPGTGLVLVDRDKQVLASVKEFFPRLGTSRGFSGQTLAGGFNGGKAAGARAGLATTAVGGSPRSIGR